MLVEEMGLVHFDVVMRALCRRMTEVHRRPGSGTRHRRIEEAPEPERHVLVLFGE